MGRGGELAHVRADLGQDDFGGALVDPGDGVQQRHLLGVRGDHLLDPRRQHRDGLVQIVDVDVELYDPMNDRHTRTEDVKERLGILPTQMRDYLALIGDAIDNVAKVPGIGPKTAVELLTQFGDVETLLARLEEVKKPKIRAVVIR